ncbi:hypothetical protein [Halobacterium wangiae]|uniref:hypothetical protein n=1 Tax=Halobacterium wangiae TaxID=2902623 RepID=UPI001E48679F|nr:hypothetical protein [Halobacterium wangiae]
MGLSRLKEVILEYTTFGGELDFPSSVFVRGIAAIVALTVFRFRVIGAQISQSAWAYVVLGGGFVVSIVLLLYFLRDAARYTTEKKLRRLTGILISATIYFGLGSIAILILYPALNSLRTTPLAYTTIEAATGATILSIATLLTTIWNRQTLKSRYSSLQSIRKRFSDETDSALDRIQTKIDGIGHIERPEADRIRDQLESGDNVPVTGEGGIGKSGVLADVAQEWNGHVLFIDASTYSTVRNDIELSTSLGFDEGVERPINQVAVDDSVLIIVDQLDDIDRKAGNIYRDFILQTAELENVSVAFACRDHDLDARPEYEALTNVESFTPPVSIGLLKTSDAQAYIQNLIGEDPDDLVQLGRKIENLDIISQLAQDGVDFSGVTGDVSLWDKFRKQLGREDHPDDGTRSGDDIIKRLTTYAAEAIEDPSDGLNIFSVGTSEDWIDRRLINKGVIEVATNRPGNRKYRFRHLDFQRYIYAWNAVQENRTIQDVTSALDERLGKDIFRFMLVLYMRSEATTTAQLGDVLVNSDTADHAQQFLEEMLDEEEGLSDYTAKTLLDEIKTWDISSNEEFANLILNNLQDRETLYDRFFDSKTDVSWAETLHERGDYTNPPSVLFGYLRELAPYHPETVAEIIRSIETEDRHSRALVVTVIRELPFDTAAELTDVVTASLTESQPDWHDFQATELLQELIEAGETKAGLDLLNALLQPRQPTSEEANKAQPITRLHSLESALEDTLETLVRAEGEQAIGILEARLHEAVSTEAEIRDQNTNAVVGPITTSIAGTDFANETTTDFKAFLIQAHRKALEHWIEEDPEDEARAELLTRYLDDITVFRRLGLYLLNEHKDHYPGLVANELLDRTNYAEVWTKEDFLRLLRDGIDVLSHDDRRQVTEIIANVPVQESLEDAAAQRSERTDDYTADELAEIAINRWRRDRLWLIRDWLADEQEGELQSLIDEYGEPDNVLSLVNTSGGFVSQESSLSEEEIWQKSPSNLIEYCIDEQFEATGWNEREGEGLSEVSPRGLAEAVVPRILEELTEFRDEIPRLRDASSIYVSELLRGLRDKIDSDPQSLPTDLPWTPILDLCETVATNPDEWSEPARMNVARLFQEAYSTDDLESVLNYNDRIKEILFIQLGDPNPTDEREHPPEGHAGYNNPAQTAINSVRPLALSAIIVYSVRVANRRGYEGYSEEDESGFEHDVREKIECEIQEGSLSTRSTIGRSLNTIWNFDHDLILDNFDTLFPRNQTILAKNRFAAVWDAYLAFNSPHETMFPHLRPCYHHGIDLIAANENTATRDVERGLARHLLIAYFDDFEDLNNPQSLLSYFYAKEEPDLARQAAWQIWRWGEDNEDLRDNWPKVRALWEWRLDEADDPEAYAAEFQWFVEWLPFIEDRVAFDNLTSLLIDTAPFIAHERRAWELVESYLADHARDHPITVIEVYTELMDQESRPNGTSFSDTTARLLQPGLDETPDVRRAALDIAEAYFTDGNDTAEQFLDKHT